MSCRQWARDHGLGLGGVRVGREEVPESRDRLRQAPSTDRDRLARLSHQVIYGPIWKHDGGGGRGFWGFPGRDDTRGRQTVLAGTEGQGLAGRNRRTSPCGYFPERDPHPPAFSSPQGYGLELGI